MERPLFLEEIDNEGVARVTLTRPSKHNAINSALVTELATALDGLASDSRTRCLVLAGEGESFCAGGDLEAMQALADANESAIREDADALATLLTTLDRFPLPTLALVHGAAIGAGLGLVACCDIVVADSSARFAMPEARLGLVPGVIAPFVSAAIGERWARYYSLTGERFDAAAAHAYGLVHAHVHGGGLEPRGREIIDSLLRGAPAAQRESKAQLQGLRGGAPVDDTIADGAARLARRRASDEGREGIRAFLDKRRPSWRRDGD
jgi:methylglutaconyl-CoA hydratase